MKQLLCTIICYNVLYATLYRTWTFSLSKQFRIDNQSTNVATEVAALY